MGLGSLEPIKKILKRSILNNNARNPSIEYDLIELQVNQRHFTLVTTCDHAHLLSPRPVVPVRHCEVAEKFKLAWFHSKFGVTQNEEKVIVEHSPLVGLS